MKWLPLSLLALLAAQSAELPKLVVPNIADLTIKTRRTIDRPNSSVQTEIIYLKGARQRREWIVDSPGRTERVSVTITQCDERRTLLLNGEARTYASLSIEDMSEHLRRARIPASRSPQRATTGGVVTITIDSVDTGKRRPMGRYVARRITTTTRDEPGPGASGMASLREQDGWYIDLPRANCWDGGDQTLTSSAFLVAVNSPDRVHVEHRGTARRGYPIEETDRSESQAGVITTKTELLEFSEAPLDAALFTVPTGHRPALPLLSGGHDLTKPDTLINRLQSYWEGFASWANRFFR